MEYLKFERETKNFLNETLALIEKQANEDAKLIEALKNLTEKKKIAEIWLYGLVYCVIVENKQPYENTVDYYNTQVYGLYFLNKTSTRLTPNERQKSIKVIKKIGIEKWLSEKGITEYFKFYQQIEICENKLKEALGLYQMFN